MSTTVEQLELEVQSRATSAVSGIDALTSSLGRLKNATKGGVGLTAVARQLTTLNAALGNVSATNTETLNKLSASLASLSALKDVKLSPTISKRIVEIGDAMKVFESQNYEKAISQIERLTSSLVPLSDAMQNVSGKKINIIGNASQLAKQTDALATANNRAAKSYVNLAAKLATAYVALRRITSVIGSWIVKSNDYQESLNLFTASMGEYAAEAKEYAEQVSELMGIDPAEWLKQQGTFMNLATGFGVAAEKAAFMSKNLTQLGYDMASFFNMSVEDSMQKLQSAIAGELEPVRRVGYDLSQAALKQIALDADNYAVSMENVANALSDTAMSSFALSEGIKVSYNDMTQAEKSQLRYIALMTQITTVQGDMARTLEAPANQLRILKAQIDMCARSLGNIFIPALTAVLPYAIAFVKAIRMIADAIASLFGFELTKVDYSGITGAAGGAADVADNLGGATKKAKELKNALLGIDELNVISPPDDSSGGGSGVGAGGGFDFELPGYDFIGEAVNSKVDEIMKKLEPMITWVKDNVKEILAGVIAIGAAFLAWKIAKGVLKALEWLSTMKGFNVLGSVGFKIAGLGLFLDAWNTMKEAIHDIMENGANFTNVTKLISGFAEGLGAAFLLFGNIKLAGASLIIAGVAGIMSDISDMVNNGVSWENAMSLVKNLGLFLAGLGFLSKDNLQLGGIGLIISGVSLVLENLKALITGFTTGDFSNVEWVEVAAGALMLVGGLILAFKKIQSTVESVADIGGAKTAIDTVKTTTEGVSGSVGQLSTKLTSLAKNLGLGLVVVVEVAAAALLITGAIILLGKELEQVGIAWQPVIDNGGTVAAAMGIGAGVLAAIGVVTALLGSIGTSLIVNLGLGIAMLALLGVSAGLFLAEIWAVGKGLDEIGKAWQPVLDNGETIATGIGLGTALLIGIGVVTAALGAATVASAGLLPLAIGLGTALLVEMAAATILFIESLVAVSKELGDNLAPALDDLNGKLPGLTTDMSDFVDFMTEFAGEVVRYTGASAVSGISATIDTIIGWFTQDPIEKLANDVDNIREQASDLNSKLKVANPELNTAVTLLGGYVDFVDELGKVAGSGGTVNLAEGLKTNLNTVGQNIVTGFNDGVKSKYSLVQTTMTNWGTDAQKWFNNSSYGGVNKEKFANFANEIVNGFRDKLSSASGGTKSSMTSWASNLKNWFTGNGYGAVNKETFGKYATEIVNGFKNGIISQYESAKSGMTTWADKTKKYFTDIVSYSAFYDIAKDVIDGFNDGINKFYDTTLPYMRRWANAAKAAYKAELDSNSPSKVFERIGEDTVRGYNLGIISFGNTTKKVVSDWANSFVSVSPVMSFAVDTSALKYYSSDDFAKSVSVNAVSSNRYTVDTGLTTEGLKEVMLEALNDSRIAEDMRRQADKQEQTIVQIGNRTVSDAVTTQRKANGYVFAK